MPKVSTNKEHQMRTIASERNMRTVKRAKLSEGLRPMPPAPPSPHNGNECKAFPVLERDPHMTAAWHSTSGHHLQFRQWNDTEKISTVPAPSQWNDTKKISTLSPLRITRPANGRKQ